MPFHHCYTPIHLVLRRLYQTIFCLCRLSDCENFVCTRKKLYLICALILSHCREWVTGEELSKSRQNVDNFCVIIFYIFDKLGFGCAVVCNLWVCTIWLGLGLSLGWVRDLGSRLGLYFGVVLGLGSGFSQKFANCLCTILKLCSAFCTFCKVENYTQQH